MGRSGAGFLINKRFLILDNDSKFSAQFRQLLEDAGVRVALTSYQAPNMNSFSERWVRSIKSECLDKLILFGTGSLERAIREYVTHYHQERSHQALENGLIRGNAASGVGEVAMQERLGGLLKYYHRSAA